MSVFGSRLKSWRRRHSITQVEACRRISSLAGVSVSASTYRKWEQGVQVPAGVTKAFILRSLVR